MLAVLFLQLLDVPPAVVHDLLLVEVEVLLELVRQPHVVAPLLFQFRADFDQPRVFTFTRLFQLFNCLLQLLVFTFLKFLKF